MRFQDYLLQKLDYSYWANHKVAQSMTVDDREVLRLFTHMVEAQLHWLKKLRGDREDYPEAGCSTADVVSERLHGAYTLFRLWLSEQDDRHLLVDVHVAEGRPAIKAYEIIDHVLFHDTYHRAQAILRLHEHGIANSGTDYDDFCTERHSA